MNTRRFLFPALSAALLMTIATPGFANIITGATGTVTCSSFSLQFTGKDLLATVSYAVKYSFTLTPISGPAITITGTVAIPAGTSGTFDVTTNGALGPLTNNYTITSSSATLFAGGVARNKIPIVFTSTTVTCFTGGGGCPATIGFWKHHAFPASIEASGLTIGGVHYSASDLLTIVSNPGSGNAVTILGPQLVGALLNLAAGAVNNSTADAAITTAESLLASHSLNLLTSFVAPSSALGQALIGPATTLDKYNNGDFHTCTEP